MEEKESSTIKRDEIIKIEKEIRSTWKSEARKNNNQKKKFITFCMPYMNGTLHLGHAYTLSKAMFLSEFYRINGYNVLFPFAFHGTGTPIWACAAKLKLELEKYQPNNYDSLAKDTQIRILLEMKVPKDKLHLFKDPNYWLIYFSNEAKRDVIDFGARIDFTRSFITTKINPYFDSFVTWQFNKLIGKGLVTYGKRYVIYSIKDGQPCADHDRSSGEGIEPKYYPTKVIEYKTTTGKLINIIATCQNKENTYNYIGNEVLYNPEEKYVTFEHQGKEYVVREYAYQNISYQMEGVKFIGEFDCNTICGNLIGNTSLAKKSTGFVINAEFDENDKFIYYEPEKPVISRSGDLCITALTPQWFINYGDEKITEEVNEYITKEFFSPDPAVKNQLLSSNNWIKEWPCSRNYGLGTLLPGTNYVIDSLSDSTIYMAYYTIAHLVETIPLDHINNEIWDYIFGFSENVPKIDSKYLDIIKEMKDEFTYWYPVDVRVSGKDLIANHLIMCLYNHMIIWDKNYCPRSYAVNGYQKLNGEKMSKHTGNFLTLRDAIEKYGSDAVRLTLAECDGIDDADFRDKIANSNILKLYHEKEWFINMIDKLCSSSNEPKKYDLWDHILNNEIKMCLKRAHEHYNNYRFRKAVYDGFHIALSNRDTYMKLCENKSIEPNNILIHNIMSSILLMIYPVCPHFVEYIWNYGCKKGIIFSKQWNKEIMNISTYEYNYYKYYKDVIDYIIKSISKITKKNTQSVSIIINIIEDYTPYEKKMIGSVQKFYEETTEKNDNIWRNFINDFCKSLDKKENKKEIRECGRFMSYVKANIEMYGNVWYKCISEFEIQQEIIKKWIPIFVKNNNIKKIQFNNVKADIKYQYKKGPGKPEIIKKYII